MGNCGRIDETVSEQLGFKKILVLPSQRIGEKAGTSFPALESSNRKAWQERWYCLFQA